MYKTKIFDTFCDLTKFLNDNDILPSRIISISTFSRGYGSSGTGKVAIVYLEESLR